MACATKEVLSGRRNHGRKCEGAVLEADESEIAPMINCLMYGEHQWHRCTKVQVADD